MQMILKAWIISQSQIRREDNPIYAACDVFEPPIDKDIRRNRHYDCRLHGQSDIQRDDS